MESSLTAIPMQDREIQNGGKLTVREFADGVVCEMKAKIADAFGPGLYTSTLTLCRFSPL